jgi:hypothetical protein
LGNIKVGEPARLAEICRSSRALAFYGSSPVLERNQSTVFESVSYWTFAVPLFFLREFLGARNARSIPFAFRGEGRFFFGGCLARLHEAT